jgi:hypothetical protein
MGLSNLGDLLSGTDVRKVVKPMLGAYVESKQVERVRVKNTKFVKRYVCVILY